MIIKIGFSPCPNDTFIFDALINKRIDNQGIQFEPILADVEALNEMAMDGSLDVSKLSYHAYGYVSDQYQILDSGSALGWGNGPLLVSKEQIDLARIHQYAIGIPGFYTTANYLMRLAFPEAKMRKNLLFSEIDSAILNDEIKIGILIHETRFTYEAKGLQLIMDLGKFWEDLTQLPIPLGGIVVHRKHPRELRVKIQKLIRRSLQFANQYPAASMNYLKAHAQEMEEEVLNKHVKTFVNSHSLSLGDLGQKAIRNLLQRGQQSGIFDELAEDLFV